MTQQQHSQAARHGEPRRDERSGGRRGQRHGHGEGRNDGALQALRVRAAEGYQPGHEQFTAFTWAAGVSQRWESTVETGNIRRYVRDLAILAVGYSGQPDRPGETGSELVSVIAPVGLGAVPGELSPVTRAPICRTFSRAENFGRDPFADGESKWLESAGPLAEQLLALLGTGDGGRLAQNHHVFGPPAVRSPKIAVNVEQSVGADGVPSAPVYVHLDEAEDRIASVGPEAVVFDMDSIGHAYDIRSWTRDSRPLKPAYGVCPWFVLPANIRTVHVDIDWLEAHWWL